MSSQPLKCAFCARIAAGNVARAHRSAVAFPDGFPVTEGHTLVVPRRHEPDLFALEAAEIHDVWTLIGELRSELLESIAPDGFNVGVNVGAAAGQTIDHAHVHVIPRRRGDVGDPRGGVRWVVPGRAAYWTGGL